MKNNYLFTSESVGAGHPDKVCDQISDAILDAILEKDSKARVACETYITRGMVVVGGEITTSAWVDVDKIVRDTIRAIGYNDPKYGFNADTCAVLNVIGRQSPDIAQGVDVGGAGDQGMMVGYACDETTAYLPYSLMLAHSILRKLEEYRKDGAVYLGPDCKSQVTIKYENGKPKFADTVVLSTQHTAGCLEPSTGNISYAFAKNLIEKIIIPTLGPMYKEGETKFLINPTGKFVIGGPQSDTGMTGRKIIVDTYGGKAPHGGGAFSGKDCTKVDRSAAYMARYIAKNLVAAGAAKECEVQIAYAIGKAEPVGFYVDTKDTGAVTDERLEAICKELFDMTPQGIINKFDLTKPQFLQTAVYGHFGNPLFAWESLDAVAAIKNLLS